MARALARGWGDPVLCTDSGSGRAQRARRRARRRGARLQPRARRARRPRDPRPQAGAARGRGRARSPTPAESSSRSSARTPLADVRAAYPDAPVVPRRAQHAGRGRARGVLAFAGRRRAASADERQGAVRARRRPSSSVPERLMAVAGAISGVGPAYWALLVEALVDAAVRRGMPAAAGRHTRRPRPWPAPPSCSRPRRRHARACAARWPRPAARPPAGWRRSSAAACAPPSPTRWTTWLGGLIADGTRSEIADFLDALILVYTLIIFA